MKKSIVFFVLLVGFIGFSANSYSSNLSGVNGIGIYGNFAGENDIPGGGVGLSLKFGNFPVLGIEWSVNTYNYSIISVTADWWFFSLYLGNKFYMYTGIGAHMSFFLAPSYFDMDVALRLVLGLNFFPIKYIELFLELAPMLTLLSQSVNVYYFTPGFGYNVRVGARWRF